MRIVLDTNSLIQCVDFLLMIHGKHLTQALIVFYDNIHIAFFADISHHTSYIYVKQVPVPYVFLLLQCCYSGVYNVTTQQVFL